VKRILLRVILVAIAASPSYFQAAHGLDVFFDRRAVVLAVVFFWSMWSVIAFLKWTDRLTSLPQMQLALKIGFGARAGLTLLFPLNFALEWWLWNKVFDSVQRLQPTEFVIRDPGCDVLFKGSLTIAIVHGAAQNALLLAFIACTWGALLLVASTHARPGGFPLTVSSGRATNEQHDT
jgi:hypothetical protein